MSIASSGGRASGRGRRRRHRVHTVAWLTAAVLAFGAFFVAGLLAAPVSFTTPAPQRPTLLVDRAGRPFGEIQAPEQREVVTADQIPEVMRQAIVAAEDKRFLSHGGVDPLALLRAAASDLTGGSAQGGSTITQQYVKNVFVGDQHSLLRKVREAALSVRLEQRLSKQEILTRYLNEVYFGQGTYGVQAASKYYFGIPASKLSLPQASMLAGVVPAPSGYNPVVSMTKARERQKYVLNRMVEAGFLTPTQASAAYLTPPKIAGAAARTAIPTVAPQYYAMVTAQIKRKYIDQQDLLYQGGLQVQTSLDLNWQSAINQAIAQVLPAANDPEAAVVAIDDRTGDVLALSDKVPPASQFDPASLADRTSGSTIKPFTLAVALQTGQSLDTYRYGPPMQKYTQAQCPNPGSDYTITNDEGGGGGYTLKGALAQSVNTVYGPLAIDLGTQKVAALAGAAGMGDHKGDPIGTNCSMGLGVTTTPLHEAVAYATLAAGGIRHDPRLLLGAKAGVSPAGDGGTQIFTADQSPVGTRVMSSDIAGQVDEAMREVVRTGTGTAAQQPAGLDVFGKTGTTDNYTDAWFTGCVPAYHVCLTTWMGYDSTYNVDGTPHSMLGVEGVAKVQGGTLPAMIFAKAMDLFRSKGVAPVPPPTTSSSAPTTSFAPVAPTPVVPVVPRRSVTARPTSKAPTSSRRPSASPSPTKKSSPPPRPSPTRSAAPAAG
ncbi:MAG TPA: transglycosylase domain-containing protein [Mycobacteriales bacterium]|nr:transglycosylase domain-containing protein [Mycobacteriales bacterium]